jgi:ribosomal protein S18 acetylase RimI-like enzyme
MDEILIRKAVLKDLDQLYVFEQGVIAAERPFDPTLDPDPIHYYDLKGMLAVSHIELVVAEGNAKVVGSGYARIEMSEPYLKHQRHAYLGFMYVLPEYRGRGINQQIVTHLINWTRAQGVTELRLEVYVGNEAAIRAYEKIGFTKHMIQMRLGLNDQENE